MEYVIGIILLALLVGGFIGSAFTAGNHPKALPKNDPPTLPEPPAAPEPPRPPRVPSWDERMEAVGIRRAFLWEAMGGYLWEIGRDSNVYAEHARPDMIGTLFVIDVGQVREHVGSMTRWDLERNVEQAKGSFARGCPVCHGHGACDDVLYEIGKTPVPAGTIGDGRPELRFLGAYCRTCGAIATDRDGFSQALGALWTEHANIRHIVEALESPDAKRAIDRAKLACVERELTDIERRRERLLMERSALATSLGVGMPYRDAPLASLDDPPDDRAKAMPALDDPEDEDDRMPFSIGGIIG